MADMVNKNKVTAIILAGGSSTRMSTTASKQLAYICSESVIHRSVRAFAECDLIDDIVVACKAEEHDIIERELAVGICKPVRVVNGGRSRAESAMNAFAITEGADYVAIHDAARPLVTPDMIARVVLAAIEHGAATAACPVTDTLKLADNGFIKTTVPRRSMYSAQTPQVFARELYEKATEGVNLSSPELTDDNMLLENIGVMVSIVDTSKENLKITEELDLALAEFIIKKREKMCNLRVGHGYDVHKFTDGRALILGGVQVPFDKGLLGHSDADVLVHAVMDALLGACALGDIGRHFPDTDDSFRSISSLVLLEKVGKLLAENGYSVVNIDATLVMQAPKIAPYIEEMRANIANTLGIDISSVNVKATTEEGLGFTGAREGAAAHAVAMVGAL